MIDYWEAIGRLAYDPELADGFLEVLPPAGEFPIVHVKRPEGECTGVGIPKEVYEAVQGYLEPYLAEGYLSLTAAGELAWAFSYKEVRKFTKAMNRLMKGARQRDADQHCSDDLTDRSNRFPVHSRTPIVRLTSIRPQKSAIKGR